LTDGADAAGAKGGGGLDKVHADDLVGGGGASVDSRLGTGGGAAPKYLAAARAPPPPPPLPPPPPPSPCHQSWGRTGYPCLACSWTRVAPAPSRQEGVAHSGVPPRGPTCTPSTRGQADGVATARARHRVHHALGTSRRLGRQHQGQTGAAFCHRPWPSRPPRQAVGVRHGSTALPLAASTCTHGVPRRTSGFMDDMRDSGQFTMECLKR